MSLGDYVDSQPAYHLSPKAEGVVVDHLFCSGTAPVLEHVASPCPAGRMNVWRPLSHITEQGIGSIRINNSIEKSPSREVDIRTAVKEIQCLL